jgi:Tfp pilus assembly protein PilX
MIANNWVFDPGLASRQKGLFLLLTLVLIAFVASVSLIGMQNAINNTKLVQSFMSHSLALQRAEQALLIAEKALDSKRQFILRSDDKPLNLGLYPQFMDTSSGLTSAWSKLESENLWQNPAYLVVQFSRGPVIGPSPIISSYIIERLVVSHVSLSHNYYRITAFGRGYGSLSEVLLQSIVEVTQKKRRVSWQKIR